MSLGNYEWNVITFCPKNARDTYQRAMNLIFHNMIEEHLEVYIDDILIKSENFELHVQHLRTPFERMRKYKLKMN